MTGRTEADNKSFQPTYKELKLRMYEKISSYIPCFQPTYKELKLITECENLKTELSFQPTYKELKLTYGVALV